MEALLYEPILRPTTAWRRFHKALDRHNDQYSEREYLKKQIRSAYVLTARAIFSDFLRAKKTGKVYEGNWYETSDALIMLATKFPRTTIQAHIIRLIETGFILGKVQKLEGVSKAKGYNYFLQVNPVYHVPEKKPP